MCREKGMILPELWSDLLPEENRRSYRTTNTMLGRAFKGERNLKCKNSFELRAPYLVVWII